MNISGTITNAQPVDSTDDRGTKYQWIVITGQDGQETPGRIGSKQGYQTGTPINVTIEEKFDRDNRPYNYFKRYNPQFVDQPAPGRFASADSYQPSEQAPSRPPQTPNAPPDDQSMRIVRGNALNAVMSAAEIPSDMIKDYLLASVHFIRSGEWYLAPKRFDPDNTDFQPDASTGDGGARPI